MEIDRQCWGRVVGRWVGEKGWTREEMVDEEQESKEEEGEEEEERRFVIQL